MIRALRRVACPAARRRAALESGLCRRRRSRCNEREGTSATANRPASQDAVTAFDYLIGGYRSPARDSGEPMKQTHSRTVVFGHG